MKAVRYLAAGHIEITDVERPKPKAGEVVVETRAASICNQMDVRVYNGVHTSYPLEPGEPGAEGAGIVAEVGAGVKEFKAGDPVAMIGSHLYAEYSVRKPEELAKLKGTTSLIEAAPLGLAGSVLAATKMKNVGSLRRKSLIISGLGPAGLFLVQLARNAGASKIVGMDIRANHFELARSLGATNAVLANNREVINTCRENPADYGFDCSGSPQAVSLLYSMCTTVVAFGTVHETVKLDIPLRRHAALINGYLTHEDRCEGLVQAVQLFTRKKLLTRPLITETMRLEEYALGMQKVRRGEVLKLVLTRS